jgi:hypothetical protein
MTGACGLWIALALSAAAAAPPSAAALTFEQQEQFLLRGEIQQVRRVSEGITGTLRVTLSDGASIHDASVQRIDEAKSFIRLSTGVELNFKDSYSFNIAAYRLARLLELEAVPPSVERHYKGTPASFTWWVDDVIMDERGRASRRVVPPDPRSWSQQVAVLRVFDELIENADRNPGNLLIDRDWKLWLIDHSRAFREGRKLRKPEDLLRCERRLLERLRALEPSRLRDALAPYLTDTQIEALLARRALLVAHFDALGALGVYDPPAPAGASLTDSD